MHCCTGDCLHYEVLCVLNPEDKLILAVFHNEQSRSDTAESNDFTD